PRAAGALLLIFHVVTQWGFYGSLMARDGADAYRSPEINTVAKAGSRVVHAQVSRLPGWNAVVNSWDNESAAVLAERSADSLYPFVGVASGLRYELNPSPEGLDSYFTYLARDAVQKAPPQQRVELLRMWGIEGLIGRPGLKVPGLDQGTAVGGMEIASYYSVANPVPEIRVVGDIVGAAGPRDALDAMLGGSFRPEESVVLAGEDSLAAGSSPLRWKTIRRSDDEILVEVESGAPSALVVQRTYQPVYRASVDDEMVPVLVADLHRTAVRVPAGARRVRLWIDRSPLRWAYGVASLAGLAVLSLALLGRRSAAAPGKPVL
ncbi:MAG: hypothetical protein K8H90_03165, partial [Thermoanaerobaculia bacterium]|nr:hypothetical protein [Thermoanaerobaculia bacterium]